MRSSRTVRQASVLSPPMLLIASKTFWPSARTPMTTNNEIEVAAVKPDARHGAVEDKAHDRLIGERTGVPSLPVALHLAPHPAHRVLANRTAEQGRERATDTARVGARQIGRCNQRVGGQRAALVSPQCLALPLCRLAISGFEPSPRNGDLGRSEGPRQRPCPAAVPVAGEAGIEALTRIGTPAIARASESGVEFAPDHRLDESADPVAQTRFDRVKPG